MPTEHIIALLIEERDKLDLAIDALSGSEQRRGRPSSDDHAVAAGTAVAVVAPLPPVSSKRKRTFTAAQRKAQAEKMKLYWAAKRKNEAKH
jgi:hypothetical protein